MVTEASQMMSDIHFIQVCILSSLQAVHILAITSVYLDIFSLSWIDHKIFFCEISELSCKNKTDSAI